MTKQEKEQLVLLVRQPSLSEAEQEYIPCPFLENLLVRSGSCEVCTIPCSRRVQK